MSQNGKLTLREAAKNQAWIGETGLLGGVSTANNTAVKTFTNYVYSLKPNKTGAVPMNYEIVNPEGFLEYIEEQKDDKMIAKVKDMLSKGEMNYDNLMEYVQLFDELAYYNDPKSIAVAYQQDLAKTFNDPRLNTAAQSTQGQRATTFTQSSAPQAVELVKTEAKKVEAPRITEDAKVKVEEPKKDEKTENSELNQYQRNQALKKSKTENKASEYTSSNSYGAPKSETSSDEEAASPGFEKLREDGAQNTEPLQNLREKSGTSRRFERPQEQNQVILAPKSERKITRIISSEGGKRMKVAQSAKKEPNKKHQKTNKQVPNETQNTRSSKDSLSVANPAENIASPGWKYFRRTALATGGTILPIALSSQANSATMHHNLIETILNFLF